MASTLTYNYKGCATATLESINAQIQQYVLAITNAEQKLHTATEKSTDLEVRTLATEIHALKEKQMKFKLDYGTRQVQLMRETKAKNGEGGSRFIEVRPLTSITSESPPPKMQRLGAP